MIQGHVWFRENIMLKTVWKDLIFAEPAVLLKSLLLIELGNRRQSHTCAWWWKQDRMMHGDGLQHGDSC